MNADQLKPPVNQTQNKLTDAYLGLQLDAQTTAAIPLQYAQEVLTLSVKRITSMPNMSKHILGLLNQRSRVFWVVDLAQMLELEPLATKLQNYDIAIIRVEKASLALAVRKVKGVMRLDLDAIVSPKDNVSLNLVPYLSGCLTEQEQIIWVLDTAAIIDSPLLTGGELN